MVDDIEIQEIDTLIATAKEAQAEYEANGSQEVFDLACQAVGWALMQPKNNNELSELAVMETGLGNVRDKIQKNHNNWFITNHRLHYQTSTRVSSKACF